MQVSNLYLIHNQKDMDLIIQGILLLNQNESRNGLLAITAFKLAGLISSAGFNLGKGAEVLNGSQKFFRHFTLWFGNGIWFYKFGIDL